MGYFNIFSCTFIFGYSDQYLSKIQALRPLSNPHFGSKQRFHQRRSSFLINAQCSLSFRVGSKLPPTEREEQNDEPARVGWPLQSPASLAVTVNSFFEQCWNAEQSSNM